MEGDLAVGEEIILHICIHNFLGCAVLDWTALDWMEDTTEVVLS